MGSISFFLNKLKKFDLEKSALEALKNNEEKVLDFNRQQLMEGNIADNTPVRPTYQSNNYAKFKQKLNNRPKYGTPDLKLSGKFYKSFYLDGIQVKSRDDKAPYLERRYSEKIYGINTIFVGEIRKLILPEIAKKFKK